MRLLPTSWPIRLKCSFGVLAFAVGFSIAGTAALYQIPGTAGSVGRALPFLTLAPTWIYLVAVPVIVFAMYLPALGGRRSLIFLGWGSVVGLMAELLGTTTGVPFGPYRYTEFLQPQVLGHVPLAIPASWYATATLALDLAGRVVNGRWTRVLTAGVFMALWDLALDPAMSHGFPIWIWETDGFLYGMPAGNVVGWTVTGVTIAWGYEVLAGGIPAGAVAGVRRTWAMAAALPLGIAAAREMWLAVAVGLAAVAAPVLAGWVREWKPPARRNLPAFPAANQQRADAPGGSMDRAGRT